MNKTALPLSALFLAALTWPLPAFAEEHHHEHGENCTHNHSHAEHAEHAELQHAAHDHAHGESCSGHHHDHAHDEHAHTEHNHAHVHDDESCSDDHNHAHNHDAHAGDAHLETVITISDRARESIAMETEKVSAAPVVSGKSYYGQMLIPPAAAETSALTANGSVRFFVRPGQKVSAGTPLYAVSSPDLVEMSANVKDAEAALTRSRAELDSLKLRLTRLAEIDVKNSELENEARFKEAEIVSLEINAERSRALWKQATAGAEFADGTLTVVAKNNATVQRLELAEGAWGERGQSALSLINAAPLEFKGTAFGNDDFSKASAELVIRLGKETLRFPGTLRTETQIDETTQARNIYFVPANLPEKIYPGQLARLDVFTPDAEHGNFVLVPNSAVIKVGVDDIVFVCDPTNPNKFLARKVKTLPSRRGMTPVSDIHAGEIIVSKGGYELKYVLPVDGNAPKRKAAGHFHADGKFHEGEH